MPGEERKEGQGLRFETGNSEKYRFQQSYKRGEMFKNKILYNMLPGRRAKEVWVYSKEKDKMQTLKKQNKKENKRNNTLKHGEYTRRMVGIYWLGRSERYGFQKNAKGNDGFFEKVSEILKILVISLIKFYQKAISPSLPRTCRFYPTCSNYSVEAIEKYGVLKGGIISLWRILRCNPFSKGGYDPVR